MADVEVVDLCDAAALVLGGGGWPDDVVRLLSESLIAGGVSPLPIIVNLGPGQTFEALDVEQMRAAGWVRADD